MLMLRKQMNKQTKKTELDIISTENKLMVARGERGGDMGKMGEGKWEIQDSNHGMKKSQEQKLQHKENSQWYYNSTVL